MAGSTTGTGKKTGRPPKLHANLSFNSINNSSRPQPEEIACIVYQYLRSNFPKLSSDFQAAASSSMPAFLPLLEHKTLPLEDLLTELCIMKQKEVDAAAAVEVLGAMQVERIEGEGEEKENFISATFTAMTQLLKDYMTHRDQSKQRVPALTLTGPNRSLFSASLSPSSSSSSAVASTPHPLPVPLSNDIPFTSTAASRKRKASSPKRKGGHSSSAEHTEDAVMSARTDASMHDIPALPSPSLSPPSSPTLHPHDYLLEIDAEGLANDMSFAEQLAHQINARLRPRDDQTTPETTPLPSSSPLAPPTRLPSIPAASPPLDSAVPPLSDADLNALLDDLVATEAFGESVYVEGPDIDQMDEERGEKEVEGDEKKERGESKDEKEEKQSSAPPQRSLSNKRMRLVTSPSLDRQLNTPRKSLRDLLPLNSPSPHRHSSSSSSSSLAPPLRSSSLIQKVFTSLPKAPPLPVELRREAAEADVSVLHAMSETAMDEFIAHLHPEKK